MATPLRHLMEVEDREEEESSDLVEEEEVEVVLVEEHSQGAGM